MAKTKFNFEVRLADDPAHYEDCVRIRRAVFVAEQGVPESLEIDSHESTARHFLVRESGQSVGTGRLRQKGVLAKFERIATRPEWRGRGAGRALMAAMEDFTAREFPQLLPAMHAQRSAVDFYLRLGWTAVGKEFWEAKIPHRLLVRIPPQPQLNRLDIWQNDQYPQDLIDLLQVASRK